MLRPKKVIPVLTAVMLLALAVVCIRSCSTIKNQGKTIDTLETTVESQNGVISDLSSKNEEKDRKISFLMKRVDEVESIKDSLNYKLDSAEFLLASKKKQNNILMNTINELKAALNLERQRVVESKKNQDSIICRYREPIYRIPPQPIPKEVEEVDKIRRQFAPRCAVMFSLNQPDCQSVFHEINRFRTKTCSNVIEYIYGERGNNLRRCGRKLNINDYESLYSCIVASHLDPDIVTSDEVRYMLLQNLRSGDLKRAVVNIYGISEDAYERAIKVSLSVFKLS